MGTLTMSDSESEAEEVLDISDPEVLAKYRLSAEIANRVLKLIIEQTKPGAKISDLCALGDTTIDEECGKVHNKGKGKVDAKDKGVAFPTCVSVNHVAGHNSVNKEDETVLVAGDLVKIDLAVHIDGWISSVAHTVLAQEDPTAPLPAGKPRDVVMACATACEAVLATIKPGCKNNDLSELFTRAAESYGVNVVEGVLSHQMKRFVIDGNKVVISKIVPGEQTVEDETFEVNDVLGIDIFMSSGEGKLREVDEKKQMVFKRAVDKNYSLKMKVSREIFSKIITDHPTLPFSLREYDDVRARLGMKECLEHELFTKYPVLEEHEGEYVAHMKFTVFLSAEGVQRVTGGILPNVEAEAICKDEELAGFYNAYVEKLAKKAAKKKKSKK